MAESPIMGVYTVGTAMSDRWLSVEEIAEYLGVSRDTVYAWIGKKDMPAHKVGRFWKFKADEVDEWVRSGKASEEPDDASSR
jgi:excisionase family DNA binding protein